MGNYHLKCLRLRLAFLTGVVFGFVFVGTILLGSLLAVYISWERLSQAVTIVNALVLVFYVGFGILMWKWLGGSLVKDWRDDFRCRVVPYFEKSIGLEPPGLADFAFYTGNDLGCHIHTLDCLARKIGVRSLSSYGYRDDRHMQRVRWFSAEEGLVTIKALISSLNDSGQLLEVLPDLRNLQRALSKAAEQGTRFSLVVRIGEPDSPYYHRQRIGHFS